MSVISSHTNGFNFIYFIVPSIISIRPLYSTVKIVSALFLANIVSLVSDEDIHIMHFSIMVTNYTNSSSSIWWSMMIFSVYDRVGHSNVYAGSIHNDVLLEVGPDHYVDRVYRRGEGSV